MVALAPLFGQVPPAAGSRPPAAESPASNDDDRFPALKDNAERLKAEYEKADTANIDEIDRLLKTRRCQINRIGGLLDRTIASMNEWHQAETTYWKKWAEVEQQRVDDQKKGLAEMEADKDRAKTVMDAETTDREELLRRKEILEKNPKRTAEIIRDVDALILDIKDSEARLADAQKQYEDVTAKAANMSASITARVINMRQNLNRVEAFGLQYTAFYEKKREEAQEVCNTKQPDSKRTVLPKGPPSAPPQ
jgi:hypothetical protein